MVNNLPLDRIDKVEHGLDDTLRLIRLTIARVDLLERELAEIKTVLRQPKGAVTRVAEDGTVAIRDPNIILQQQRTGTRGYTPYEPPPG